MPTENPSRWTLVALLVIGMVMSKYYRGRADRAGGRVARRGDGPLLVAALSVSGIAGLGSLLLYMIKPAWMAWSQIDLPREARWAGAGVSAVALGLFWWVFHHLGSNVTPTGQTRAQHTLVVTGPYRWVRHPMYVSGLMLFGGYALLAANWFIALTCGLAIGVLIARLSREERHLIDRFGDEYREYARRTGRFMPRL